MILGASHLGFGCSDWRSAEQRLAAQGFQRVFVECDRINAPAKRNFLHTPAARHTLLFCQASKGIAIEALDHGQTSEAAITPYHVLLGGVTDGSDISEDSPEAPEAVGGDWHAIWQDALGNGARQQLRYAGGGLWCDQVPGSYGVQAILVPVVDLDAATSMWTAGLGFREKAADVSPGRRWRTLRFNAPVEAWSVTLILAERRAVHRPLTMPMLDQEGFVCLALYSSNLDADRERLIGAGVRSTTDVFKMVVNERPLRLCLFRGTEGEPLELIQFAR